MLKNRTFGILSIVAGIIVNNVAYLVDVMRDTHSGYIYLGSNGILVAVVGVILIVLGTFVLTRLDARSI
ncbi:MAG: hypothetical protein WD470_09555 [Rhodospirillaceae bacterium]